MFLLNLLQEHGQQAAEHGAKAGHAKHVPIIVEMLNHWIGKPVFEIQKAIMPQIYKALKIFGPHWPGENKTFQEYLDGRAKTKRSRNILTPAIYRSRRTS
jgi:hypothetical protein